MYVILLQAESMKWRVEIFIRYVVTQVFWFALVYFTGSNSGLLAFGVDSARFSGNHDPKADDKSDIYYGLDRILEKARRIGFPFAADAHRRARFRPETAHDREGVRRLADALGLRELAFDSLTHDVGRKLLSRADDVRISLRFAPARRERRWPWAVPIWAWFVALAVHLARAGHAATSTAPTVPDAFASESR